MQSGAASRPPPGSPERRQLALDVPEGPLRDQRHEPVEGLEEPASFARRQPSRAGLKSRVTLPLTMTKPDYHGAGDMIMDLDWRYD